MNKEVTDQTDYADPPIEQSHCSLHTDIKMFSHDRAEIHFMTKGKLLR